MLLISINKRKQICEKQKTLKDVRETKHVLALFPKPLDEEQLSFCFFCSSEAGVITAYDLVDYERAKKEFEERKTSAPDHELLLLLETNTGGHIMERYKPLMEQYKPRFPLCNRENEFAIHALNKLKELKLIKEDLQESYWLYIFGYDEPESTTTKIIWLGTKEQLRYYLVLWYEKEISEAKMPQKSIFKLVPLLFIDKKGKQMTIAKKRNEDHTNICEQIKEIFRPEENAR